MIRASAALVAALSFAASAWSASAQPRAERTETVVANDGTAFDVFGSPEVRALLARFLAGAPLDTTRITLQRDDAPASAGR